MNFSSFWDPDSALSTLSTPSETMHTQNISGNNNLDCSFQLDLLFWVVNGIIGAAILLGNTFTCVVFLSRSHLRQNYMNIYLVSLAVADILMGLLVVPGFAAFCSGCTYKWSEYCWLFGGARDIAFPATVLNLLAITYDRYLAVLRPLQYASTMTKRKVFSVLVAVWVTPLIVSSVRSIWQHSWESQAVKNAELVYNAILSTVFGFSPVPILLIVNLKIMRTIKSHGKRIHVDMIEGTSLSHTDPAPTSGLNQEFTSNITIIEQNRRNAYRRKKGTMSCVLVVLIFIISWLPRQFLNICILFGRRDLTSPLLVKLSLFFLFFQSSVNPAIYSFYRNDFRQAARRLIKRQR